MTTTQYTVPEMGCEGCEDIITDAVSNVNGVQSIETDLESKTVTVEGDVDTDEVVRTIDYAGYEASLVEDADETGADEEPASTDDADADTEAEEA
ncbi:heavy-metal-associated domain-containing protein [Halobacteriaceae archaeon GCM10025711]